MNLSNKSKLLILGGKPIGSCEIVEKAKELGIYTIVSDYLSVENSPAKRIANEHWSISTNEIDVLKEKCIENNVTGVIAAVHEFNIAMAIKLNELLGFNNVCSYDTWIHFLNKQNFKKLCIENNLQVAKTYSYDEKETIEFPVITKPIDGSGSRGFSVCHDITELEAGYKNALKFSESKNVLIEEYIPYNSVIIHYTIVDGKAIYSGMSDKKSMQLANNAGSVMALQVFPSINEKAYLDKCDKKMQNLIQDAGFKNGVLWIEAFNNYDTFIFNEIGYRFGGSLTYYPVKYFTQFNQLNMLVKFAIGEQISTPESYKYQNQNKKYAILPLHVKPGKIKCINGIDKIKQMQNVYAYVPVHFVGDTIENWASAQQVLCYIHILFDTYSDLKITVKQILEELKVLDENNQEQLFCLYDINQLKDS